jgi:hypothetical protein
MGSMFLPSSLGRSYSGWARWPQTARLGEHRFANGPSKLARLPFTMQVDNGRMRLAMRQGLVGAVALLHPPNPGRAGTRPFPIGDGEPQCSKVRSDEVVDGPSLRSQAATGPCAYSSLEQRRSSTCGLPSGVRVGRVKEINQASRLFLLHRPAIFPSIVYPFASICPRLSPE